MPLSFLYDPIRRSKEVERLVMRGNRRAYYRFRSSKHYGGIVTADTIGCVLECAFCWNRLKNTSVSAVRGEFCTAAKVVAKLKAESSHSGYDPFRVSGGEPILGERSAKHLGQVLSAFPRRFVVETNGIMIGSNPRLLDFLLPHDPLF